MDKLAKLTAYIAEFRAIATQLSDYKIARHYMEAGIPAAEAAKWANLGFTPEEALPLIDSGLTPELAAAADPKTDEEFAERIEAEIEFLNRSEGRS